MFQVAVKVDGARAKAQKFLEDQLASLTDVYDLAIVSYALQLADSLQAQKAWNKLDQKAQTSGKCTECNEGTISGLVYGVYSLLMSKTLLCFILK